MAAGGLSLAQLLSLEAQAGIGSSHKAIINVYLPGGPSHLDLVDLKPDAPVEVRGEFSPIRTNVSGMEICEVFPRMAKMMDKFAIIRSVVGSEGRHDGYQCMTGRTHRDAPPAGGWPMLGSCVSKLQGPVNSSIPANVSLMYPTGNRTWGEPGTAGYIGSAHDPMSLVAKDPLAKATSMTLQGISLQRLADRRGLLRAVDRFRRRLDQSTAMEGMDTYAQQALSILTSSKLAEALDLSREDPRIVERYGQNDPTYQRDGAPKMVRNFLVARRLVEAGGSRGIDELQPLGLARRRWHELSPHA